MTINPPTGDEQPQKYYSGSYLDEELELKRELASAVAEGREPDLEGIAPITIQTVAPELLTSSQTVELETFASLEQIAKDEFDNGEGVKYEDAVSQGAERLQPVEVPRDVSFPKHDEEDEVGVKLDNNGEPDEAEPSGVIDEVLATIAQDEYSDVEPEDA